MRDFPAAARFHLELKLKGELFLQLIISGIETESIVDGPGFRYAIFTQGCPHHCEGCHNPETWPFEGGKAVEIEELFAEIQANPILKGVTFSGGEPFCQPAPLAELAKLVHGVGKDVVTYTGYTYEQLLEKQDPDIDALLNETDLLIDGPFILAQRDLELTFRGSANQRLIDLRARRGHT